MNVAGQLPTGWVPKALGIPDDIVNQVTLLLSFAFAVLGSLSLSLVQSLSLLSFFLYPSRPPIFSRAHRYIGPSYSLART